MASAADIPAPVSEKREEQGGNLVDQASDIYVHKLPSAEQSEAQTQNRHPTVEGENFLTPPSIGEVHYEVNSNSPDFSEVLGKPNQIVKDKVDALHPGNPKLDDQPIEIAANEETSSGGIQHNAEESISLDKVETKKSRTFVLEGGELNVQVEKKDEKVGDGKTAGEDVSCNLTTDASKGECDQIKMNSEQEGLGTERNLEDNLDSAEEKGSEENSTSTEIMINETSNSDELQRRSELDSSFSKEEDVAIQKDDRSVSTTDESGVILENPEESLHVAPGNIDASTLGQEKHSKSSPEDQSSNENLHENTGGETEEKSIDVVDTLKETLESPSTIAASSPEEGSTNAVPLDVSRDHTDEKIIEGTETQKKVDEETPLPRPLGREDSDKDESVFLHEAQIEDGETRKAEFCENESAESTLLKIDKSEDSLHATSEDIHAPETETRSSIEEQTVTTQPQGILDEKTNEDETVDAEEMGGTNENVPTFVSNEKTEENSLIQVDGPEMRNEDHLEKDTEQFLVEDFAGKIVTDEVKVDDENTSRAELIEEKITESALLKEAVQKKKPLESLHAGPDEDIKESDLDQHTETTSFLEEQSLSQNPQEILGEETEEKTIDAANNNKETQDLQKNVSNEDEEDSLIQVDAEEVEQDAYLEKEMERPSLTKASVEDDESTTFLEPKIGNECPREDVLFNNEKNIDSTTLLKNEELQYVPEDQKASPSREDIETTCSHEEESVVMSATNKKKATTHENVATEIQHENTEEHSVAIVDCSKKAGENASLAENPIEETKADESNTFHELENKEDEEDTASTSVKEETELENPVDSFLTAPQDIKASDSCQDTNSSIMEQIPTANPQEVSSDKIERQSVNAADANEESLEDIEKIIPDEDNADCSPIEEDGSQKPSLEDATSINNNDEESKHEAKPENEKNIESSQAADQDIKASALGQDGETSSPEEQSLITDPQIIMDDTKEDKTNDATDAEKETPEDKENIAKTTPYEDIEEKVQEDCPKLEQNRDLENDSENTSLREAPIGDTTEGTLDKEEEQVEKPIESLQVTAEDIKVSATSQETNFTEEKTITADPQEISCDKIEEKTTDSVYAKMENLKDVADVPNENRDNSQIEVEGTEKPSLEETSIGNTNDDEPTIIHDAEFSDKSVVKSDLLGNEENIEFALVKEEVPLKPVQEEAQEERPVDSLQEAREEIKASDSVRDTNSSFEVEPQTAYPQEISSDKTEKESIYATNRGEESLDVKDIATNIPEVDDAVNSHIAEDSSQKSYSEEAKTRNDSDVVSTVTCDAELVGENEKNTECNLVKEEVSTELLQGAGPNTKLSDLGQDGETSSLVEDQCLTTNPQGIMDETNKDKAIDATHADNETPEVKDVAKTTPYEDVEENLPVQVDDTRAEQNEDSVNHSENTSLTEALIGETREGTLEKEEALKEKHIESLQVATEDIKASASCQETSSIEEQILTAGSQEISPDRIEERTIDAAYTEKENLEDVAKKIPNENDEDNSPIEVDGLEKPPLEEASTENEDIKPTASSQDTETSHQKEQGVTRVPQEIVGDREGETMDETDLKEEALEDKVKALEDKSNATTSLEDNTENSLLEQKENWEKASESTSVTEASTIDTIEKISVKEEAEVKDHHLESLQVATEDTKPSASCQETTSVEEQILTAGSREISHDTTDTKTTDSAYTEKGSFEDVAINVPSGDNEDDSPIEIDGTQKQSLKEASTGNANDENENNIECHLVKEESSVKSLQVENEDTEATAPSQDRETSHIEEQVLITTNPQGITGEHKEENTNDVTDLKEETHEDKSSATTTNEDTMENSLVQVDCLQLEQNEHSEKDSESTSLAEAPAADTKESTLVKKEAQDEDHTESLQVATEDIRAVAPCQDTKTSSTEDQILDVDPEDISRDETIDKTTDASDKERTLEFQEKNKDGPLKEDVHIESSQVATEDTKASNSSEDRETNSQEEQIHSAYPEGLKDEDKEIKTVDPSELLKETPKDEMPEEIENADFEARNIEFKEEEGYLKDMPTAVSMAAHEEKDSNPIAVEFPCTKDLDVKEEDAVGHLAEDPNSKQKESSIMDENVPDATSLASEVSEWNTDHKDVEEAGDQTDTEKIAVLDDGSIMILANETVAETDPSESTEAEVHAPIGEKEAEFVQEDLKTETDQKDREGELLIKDSQVVSELKEVNDEEEKTNLDDCKEISGSSNSGALEEVSSSNAALDKDLTSNSIQETRRETREEAENEEAQKQEEEIHVSALVHNASKEKIENDVQLCVTSAVNSEISQVMQKPEEASLPAADKNIIETTECKESEIAEDSIKKQEEDDRTESFVEDNDTTEREQEETGSVQEKTSAEKVETTMSTSVLEGNDFLPVLPSETSGLDHSTTEGEATTDKEELHTGKKASDDNEETKIENNRSITDLESKIDNEAPEITGTTPTAAEGRDVESTSVEEAPTLISKCNRDGYEHAYTGSVTEEKSDSNEVAFEPAEQKSESESKNQVVESVAQVQSRIIISETEETKTDERDLAAAGETKSNKVVAEDIFGQEETKHEKEITKESISSEKTKEDDEDVEDYRQGSHQEETITGSHLINEAKQEEEIDTEEIYEDRKNGNETEKVSKFPKEAEDNGSEEPEENLLAHESTDRNLDQKDQVKSVQEVTTALETEEGHGFDIAYVKIGAQNSKEEMNSSTAEFPDKEENRTGEDDTKDEMAKDEGFLNQNTKYPEIDAAARELPKGFDENITCEAPISKFHETIEDFKAKKEQQEEHSTREYEVLPVPELVKGKESEKYNQNDEICGTDKVQAKDEENLTRSEGKGEEENKADTGSKPNEDEDRESYVEVKQLVFSSHTKDISEVSISAGAQVIPEDNENSTTKNKSSEEEYPKKCTESQIATVSDDIELAEQASEVTTITAEMQEPEAGIGSLADIPNSFGADSQLVEEVSDKCRVMTETSTPVEPAMISTSKIILEHTEGTSLEVEDQQTKLHDLAKELSIKDTDDPENLQNVRDISEDVQGSNEGSFEVSNKDNPLEADIETSEGQETEALKKETEYQQLGSAPGNVSEAGVNCEEEKSINDKSNELEDSWSAETEKVSESNTHRSLIDETAQNDKDEGSQRQIDSPPILPQAKCSDIETTEKDILVHFAGSDSTEVTPLPSKDKHVVLEADQTNNLNPENANGDEKISAERTQGEHDLLEPSKVEPQQADCGNEERTDQEQKETNKPSLSDLFEVSMRETSKMAKHSAIDEEPTSHTDDLQAEKPDEAEHEKVKTDEEKDDEDESSEQKGSEQSSEAPVMVDLDDADVKVCHKKSHNILSGVGSKVKHSIAKVKKAITGKSSHPKPPSPKKSLS